MIAKWLFKKGKQTQWETKYGSKMMTNDLTWNENLKKITILKLFIDSFNISYSEIEIKEQYALTYDVK